MARPGDSSNWTSFGDLNWGGKFFRILFFLALINALSLVFLQKDLWGMVGVQIISRTDMSIVFFIAVAVYAWVNTEHHPSDQYFNAAMVILLMVVLAGNNIGISINADEAVSNVKEQVNKGAQNVKQQVVQTSAGAIIVEETPVQSNHLWYNIFKSNSRTGGSASVCYQLLKSGNTQGYVNRGCDTGAPIANSDISKCQSLYKSGKLNEVEKVGCGYVKPPYLSKWCALDKGDKGQLRDALCRN